MVALRLAALGLCLGLAAAAPSWGAAAKAPAAKPANPLKTPASTSKAAPIPPGKVDPAAVTALNTMSAFLQSQSGFALTTETSLDLVAQDGQRLQLDGTAAYKVRKPNGFVIDVVSDSWTRRYIYDGRQFTLYAPKMGFFSTVPAPPTNREAIAEIEDKFGISLPLDDLFRWAEPSATAALNLLSGYLVGVETVAGVKTNHYAFRDDRIDWQIWIQQGDQPLPRKLVIIDRRDPAMPAYVARLTWTLNPPLTDADFAFSPPQDAKRIRITLLP